MMQSWGSGMSQQQRLQIDAVTAHIASTSSLALHRVSQSFEGSCNQAGANAVQLAAMKALLASMLSPAPHRPPFLPQALALFTQVTSLPCILTLTHSLFLLGILSPCRTPESCILWSKSAL